MKKAFNIFLILILLSVSFVCPSYRVKAKTIADMKKELTEDQRIHVAKQFAKNLEKLLGIEKDQDIKITKNQPKKINLDAGFMEN